MPGWWPIRRRGTVEDQGEAVHLFLRFGVRNPAGAGLRLKSGSPAFRGTAALQNPSDLIFSQLPLVNGESADVKKLRKNPVAKLEEGDMANDRDGKRIGLRFSEKMSGYFLEGETDFEKGEKSGKVQNSPLSFEVTIDIGDVSDFCKLIGHQAALTGTVSCGPLGENLPIRNGRFGLFRPDAATGKRHMTYSFDFQSSDGRDYSLYGYKVIFDDPYEVDLVEDMTRLFTRIYRGTSADAPLFGSGILHFRMESLPSMLASFEVTNTSSLIAKTKAVSQFFSFCYGELRDTYVSKHTPVYHTEYENLVLRGKLSAGGGEERNFFFFSGVHDKDFPWGDDEVFWDVALMVEKDDGGWERYALTDRIIDGLELDVGKGRYRYSGPIYRILEGYQVSRSEMKRSPLPGHLREVRAEIEFRFETEAYDPVDVPFSLIPNYGRFVPRELVQNVREWVPQLESLGWHMIPHKVLLKESRIFLQEGSSSEEYFPCSGRTLGEAERSTLHEPPLAAALLQLLLRPEPRKGRDLGESPFGRPPGEPQGRRPG